MSHCSRLFVAGVVLCALVTAAKPVLAQSDTTFTYQGELKDGGSLATGLYGMDFSLWDDAVAGAQIESTISLLDISVVDGRFTVELDFGGNAFIAGQQWLQIDVNATPLAPRQPITRTPYAIQTRGIVVDPGENVGIGTAAPQYRLHVESPYGTAAAITNTLLGGPSYAVVAEVLGEEGIALFGQHSAATGVAPAVLGWTYSSSDSAVAIQGTVLPSSPGSSSAGVRGENYGTGPSGIGVYGAQYGGGYGVYGTSPTGIGVFGHSRGLTSGAFNEGVRGQVDHVSGFGVRGVATATGGPATGVHGTTASSSGTGVWGWATAASGSATGVLGRSDSPTGSAVRGFTTSTTGENYGVWGDSNSSLGYGVFATNHTSFGKAMVGLATAADGTGAWGLSQATTGAGIGVMGGSLSVAGFDFWAMGAGLDYGTSSSIRWKRNVERIDEPLYLLSKLRGVYYDWDEEHGGHHDIGMIAEEVGAVLPEIVRYEENGIDAIGMDYSKLTPLLVEAVNALREQFDYQLSAKDAEIRDLQERLAAIESRFGPATETRKD